MRESEKRRKKDSEKKTITYSGKSLEISMKESGNINERVWKYQ